MSSFRPSPVGSQSSTSTCAKHLKMAIDPRPSAGSPLPVFFFSHGSTLMLGERSAPAAYWEEVGRQALRQGVERIVMMGAHWECRGNRIEVSANPNPPKQPVTWVDPKKYKEFDTNPDLEFAKVVRGLLADKGFEVYEQPEFESIHDTFMIQKWMFPKGKSLPTVIVSHNARFDPHFHMKIGAALRPLRYQNVLIIGSGGAVHNLYRNNWKQVTVSRDSYAQERPPEQWAIDFGQAFSDVVTSNNGPALRRGLSRLMQHPQFRDAQGTDDHFMSALFAAGAAGDEADAGKRNYAGAECWELLNMRNSQFQFGDWPQEPHITTIHEAHKVADVTAM